MKKLEFTTGKGRFVVVDGTQPLTGESADLIRQSEWSIRLDDVRHAKAREILDQSIHTGLFAHYVEGIPVNTYCYKDWRDSLECLIKSKGWYINQNPVQESIKNLSEKEQHYRQIDADWLAAERKTLFNPMIFKIK